ncbi:MAG: YIP1 family protein [Caldilineaceae bacterium SB0675_bin_29]|uniref:YIP1 family protein n=1 Tax=Caldilineaceae bacterium SB0675_bin_29 TaxID=2605266 RepID=A0A6B1FXN2_9CHLR|nr:YIP1 family protein [Caldilineaceae bacterium SB0675_bin_29]
MLQPQNYPRFIGKALLLEPDPFVEMVDDDNPWIEGLFLCACIGVLVAVAQLIGSLLLTASLPSSDALLNTVLQILRQGTAGGETLFEIERTLRNGWPLLLAFSGYDSVGFRLLTLATTPLGLIGHWLLFGFVSHLLARAAGGQGTLAQTLGALALSNAPRLLYLFTVIPFVSVAAVLIHVWGILIAFRGLEVAHELPPRPAALVAVGTYLLLLLVSAAVAVAFGALLLIAGGSL